MSPIYRLKIKSLFVALLVFLLVASTAAKDKRKFPQVRNATFVLTVGEDKPEGEYDFYIEDLEGSNVYNLHVSTVSFDNRSVDSIDVTLYKEPEIKNDKETKYEPNLLNPDYYGHGGYPLFQPEDFCPVNIDAPINGSVREFFLREMHINVKITEVEFSSDFCPENRCISKRRVGGLRRAVVTITVEPSNIRNSRPRNKIDPEIKECE